jgi:hypothetical protein
LLLVDLVRLSGSLVERTAGDTMSTRLAGLNYPVSCQVLPDGHILLAEYRAGRVTERDRRGEVVWSTGVGDPVVWAERLPNGHTFVATRNRLVQLRPDGGEVYRIVRPTRDVAAARALSGGRLFVLTQSGTCLFLSRSGRELGRFETGAYQAIAAGVDVLPGGRVLVPHLQAGKVVEYGPDGTVLWEAPFREASGALRLSGGRTLVWSTTRSEVRDLDRAGRTLWRYTTPEPILQALRLPSR